jgi:hypothetical protein
MGLMMRVETIGTPGLRKIAHAAVARALRMGDLTRPSDCAWCGDNRKTLHAHHPDYNRPMMVVWICPKCHIGHHGPRRRARLMAYWIRQARSEVA